MNLPKVLLLLLTITILSTAIACKEEQANKMVENGQSAVDSLFDAYHHFKLKINPLEATSVGYHEYNTKIVDYLSPEVQQEMIAEYSAFIKAIDKVDQSGLNASEAMSLKVMRWDSEIKKTGLTNPLASVASPMFDLPNINLLPINQIFSFHLYFINFSEVGGPQPFNTVEDYENWLIRIDEFLALLKTAKNNMESGISQGVVLPKVIIEKIISQIPQFTNPNIDEHLFYSAIKNMPASINPSERNRLSKKYSETISDKIIPAYQELEDFLSSSYLAAGTETDGLGALPNGPETYQYLIKYHTSTDMTPDEIFELGQKEVERIEKEMEKVKNAVGFNGSLKDFFDNVRTNKALMPFSEPEQVIENFNAIHERMQGKISVLFDLKPKAAFEVRRTQAFREASASAEYMLGSKDGSRPGIFYVPIPNVGAYNTYGDEALFLHEAIPGHHYQLSLQMENTALPDFLKSEGMGVYVEGWALYAESLGKELGLYQDPYQYFGMLSAEMHRAIRLVVDSGLHSKGWTREQAIQYSLDHEAESEASIISEVERYMVAPGQALAYKVGQLKIMALRKKAETALGTAFSIKEFHNQVLGSGSLPLVLLEEKIDQWISAQQ